MAEIGLITSKFGKKIEEGSIVWWVLYWGAEGLEGGIAWYAFGAAGAAGLRIAFYVRLALGIFLDFKTINF